MDRNKAKRPGRAADKRRFEPPSHISHIVTVIAVGRRRRRRRRSWPLASFLHRRGEEEGDEKKNKERSSAQWSASFKLLFMERRR